MTAGERILVALLDVVAIGLLLKGIITGQWTTYFGAAGAVLVAAEVVRASRLTR